jgi:hypothetical protein
MAFFCSTIFTVSFALFSGVNLFDSGSVVVVVFCSAATGPSSYLFLEPKAALI